MLDLAMRMFRGYNSALFCPILTCAGGIRASHLRRIQAENGAGQLVVYGKPFLIRGGELGNSSAGTAAQAERHIARDGTDASQYGTNARHRYPNRRYREH